MKLKTIIKLLIWVVFFILLYDLGLELLSQANTIENIIGLFIIALSIFITIKTKGFTSIKIKKKNGKN